MTRRLAFGPRALRPAGFTLIEVMIALAILLPALVLLISASQRNAHATNRARALMTATNLARAKMLDIEEELLFTGFQDMTESLDGDFDDEGFPRYRWEALVEKVELPPLAALQQAGGEDEGDDTSSSSSGGLLGMAGGLLGGSAGGIGGLSGDAAAGMMGMFYETIASVLENGIRKITLTMRWKVGRDQESMVIVCYFTDPKAVDNALGSMGLGSGSSATTSTTSGSSSTSSPSSKTSTSTTGTKPITGGTTN